MCHKIVTLMIDGIEAPTFCQLYVMDRSNTELEPSLRLGQINSASTDREVLRNILGISQNLIRNKSRDVHT